MTDLLTLWAQPLAAALLEVGLALLLADEWLRSLSTRARRWLQHSLVLAWLLYVLIASQNMTQSAWSAMPTTLWIVLGQTHFGWTQCLALAACLLLVSARPQSGASRVGLAGLLLSRAATGHAAQSGLVSWALPIQFGHLTSASLWLGSVLLASLRQPTARSQAAQMAQRLSWLATWSLGLILVSGCWNAAQRLPRPLWPSNSPYSGWLLCKLGLVALAVTLGAINRAGFLPDAQRQHPQALRRFWLVLRLEAGVLLAVLLLASRLATTMPG